MAVLFSAVTLTADNNQVEFLAAGIPRDADDLEGWTAYENFMDELDELYLFLTNMTAIEYIRNAMKRVRKKDSSIILASQNIEDFLIPSIREFTKPLFSIPTHQFLLKEGLSSIMEQNH